MLNTIGQHRFIELQNMPDMVGERVEVIQRPGVDGTMFRRLGYHGDPFSVVSRVDCQNLQVGRQAFLQYKQTIGTGPLAVVHDGMPLIMFGLLFVVLDVKARRLISLTAATGGLNWPSYAWLECDWILMPVVVTT